MVLHAPEGPFEIRYPNLDDVKAKSVAANMRKACEQMDYQTTYRLLLYSPTLLELADARYREYFNDLSGKGMAEDIQDSVKDQDLLQAIQWSDVARRLADPHPVSIPRDSSCRRGEVMIKITAKPRLLTVGVGESVTYRLEPDSATLFSFVDPADALFWCPPDSDNKKLNLRIQADCPYLDLPGRRQALFIRGSLAWSR